MRGRFTIERSLRRVLGVQPGDVALQAIEDGRLVIRFVRVAAPHDRSLAGILGPPPRLPDPGKSWEEPVEEAIDDDD